MSIVSQSVLIESSSARSQALAKISDDRGLEILNKAKALVMALWQGTGRATIEQVADYYNVSVETIKTIVKRNEEELKANGTKKLVGKELQEVRKLLNLGFSAPHAWTFTPRGMLCVGMILSGSEVAIALRTVLLDIVESKPVELVQQQTEIWQPNPESISKILRDSLGRTKLSPETQEIAVLRGLQSGFPQLKPYLDDAIAIIQESTATLDRHVSPTKLGELYAQKYNLNKPPSPIAINNALLAGGFQEFVMVERSNKKLRKVWNLTEKGKEYGVVQQDKAAGLEKTVENVRWLPDVIDLIAI